MPGEHATAETTQKDDGEHLSLIQSLRVEKPLAREPADPPVLVATQPLPIVVPRSTATNRAKERNAQGESPHMEPVRVTIGRVEVRAVMAPQPQRTMTRTAPPSLPLDDYLRNRGKA